MSKSNPSVLAGSSKDVFWNAESKEFTSKGSANSSRFTICTMSYWQWQEVLELEAAVEKIRKALQYGLVEVDGSAQLAADFIAHPSASLVNPLFQAIVDLTTGN